MPIDCGQCRTRGYVRVEVVLEEEVVATGDLTCPLCGGEGSVGDSVGGVCAECGRSCDAGLALLVDKLLIHEACAHPSDRLTGRLALRVL